MFKFNQKQKIYLSIIVVLNVLSMILGLANTSGYSVPIISIIGACGTISIILTGVLAQSLLDTNLVKVKDSNNSEKK